MNNRFIISELKNDKRAYDLLLQFNKKIAIYKTEEEMTETIKKFLLYGNPIGIVLENQLIAYYNLYCNNYETYEAYFGNLFVLEEYRRQGIAKELVVYAISMCKEKKFRRILLHVAKDNYPAISLYESLGFEYTGNLKQLGQEDCFEMALDLGEL